MRLRRLTALIVTLGLLAAGAPVASAQQAPSLGAPEPEETAPAPVTTTAGDDGLDPWQQVLIFAAGIVLLGGIAFAIVGDARQRTRGTRGTRAASDPEPPEGVAHHHKQRAKRQARAKAKAARAQRRRNR